MNGPSISSSISAALDHTQRILFQPFRFTFWLKLGIIILFIAGTPMSSGTNFNLPDVPKQPPSSPDMDIEFLDNIVNFFNSFFYENLFLSILLILLIIAVIIGLSLLFAYLQSLARFMFVDAILKEDIDLKESFSLNRNQGFNFWLWSILITIGTSLIAILIGGGILGSVFLLEKAKVTAILLIIFFGLLFLLLIFSLLLFWSLTVKFIPAIMYLEKISFWDAWRTLLFYIKQYWGKFILFLLMLFVLNIIIGIGSLVVLIISLIPIVPIFAIIIGGVFLVGHFMLHLTWNVATISIAAVIGIILLIILRYAWSVLLSPFQVFLQSYSLAFLDGCNPDWGINLINFKSKAPKEPEEIEENKSDKDDDYDLSWDNFSENEENEEE